MFSTVAAISKEISCELDLVSFIRSTSDCAEGPYHCWINRFEGDSEFLQKDGAYLLLAESFLDDSPGSWGDRIVMLQKVKLLQQRYPWLHVFGFQSCSSMSSEVDCSLLMDKIMEEYITFPILLCSNNFPELASGACCILLNGLKSPPLYDQNVVDLCTLDKGYEDRDFEIAKLMRPAASWYHALEDCLYLVDSEL